MTAGASEFSQPAKIRTVPSPSVTVVGYQRATFMAGPSVQLLAAGSKTVVFFTPWESSIGPW